MTPQEYNEAFSRLNGVPLNAKWAPEGQMAYLKGLLTIQARNGTHAYKDPMDYQTQPTAPAVAFPQFPSVAPITVTTNSSLHDALKSAQATVKAIEGLISRGI